MNRRDQKARLIRRIRNLKAEISQLLTDAQSYNDNNPHGAFIDIGEADLLARYAQLDEHLKLLTGMD